MAGRDYSAVWKAFGTKIPRRGKVLNDQYEYFIQSIGIDESKVHLQMDLLFEVVLNYFADILRIKDFHEHERVNSVKIAAYSAYWILRIKPIQIIQFDVTHRERFLFLNEYFAVTVLFAYLFNYEQQYFHNPKFLTAWNRFYDYIVYSFHHRKLDPQSIELAIEALLAESPYPIKKKKKN
jgi:hypothetical protein